MALIRDAKYWMATPSTPLTPSDACFNLIKSFEGLRLKAYLCPAGVPTIGYGSTGRDIKLGMVWTIVQADGRLRADVASFSLGVRALLGKIVTSQGELDALVSFAYNCGLGALKGSTLLKKHLKGDKAGAKLEFGKWVKGGGKVLPGLVRRRAAEAALYTA